MSEQIHKSAIRTVAAYQTVDGQKFHTPGEAQEHTRLILIDSIILAATKADPQFARLDADLLRKFCRAYGKHVGEVTTEPFEPLPVGVTETALQRSRRAIEEAETRRAFIKPSVTVTNTSRPGETPRHGDHVEAAIRTDFGPHPLDPLKGAMDAVDRKLAAEGKVATVDLEGITDEEIAHVLRKSMAV